jgi:hypothetical protein
MYLSIPRRKKMFIMVIAADAAGHCVVQEVMSLSYACLSGVNSERSVGSGLRFDHVGGEYPQLDAEHVLSVGFELE